MGTIFIDTKTNRKVVVVRPIEPGKCLVERIDDHVQYYVDLDELEEAK